MKQHNELLAGNSLEKAEESLKAGYNNIDSSLAVAQNSAYYAVFYMVLALSYLDGFATNKHHQLMGWFNKKYIYQDKIFDYSLAKIYSTLMLNREKSDYDVTENPTKEIALKSLESAKIFIDTVKPYILKKFEE